MSYSVLSNAVISITSAYIDSSGLLGVMNGTGFFIDDSHIISAAHLFQTSSRTPATNYYIQKTQRIVGSLNGTLFDLSLVGMSPVNDIAVLKASNAPSHGSLSWATGQSIGEKVYTLGNLLNMDTKALSEGILRNTSMTYVSDAMVGELVDVNMTLGGGDSGGPLVDSNNNVIGMVSFTLNWQQFNEYNPALKYLISSGTVAGPTSGVIQEVANDILAAKNVINVSDPLGDWLQWKQAALGATYSYVSPGTLLQSLYGQESPQDMLNKPIVNPNIQGVMIDSMEAGSNLSLYLYPGDVITAVNGIPVGYMSLSQKSLGQALMNVPIGSAVDLSVLVKSRGYTAARALVTTVQLTSTNDHIRENIQIINTGFFSDIQGALEKLAGAIAGLIAAIVGLIQGIATVIGLDVVTFGAATAALAAPIGALGGAIIGVAKAVQNLIKTIQNSANTAVNNAIAQAGANAQKSGPVTGYIVKKNATSGSGLQSSVVYFPDTQFVATPFMIQVDNTHFKIPETGSYTATMYASVIGPAGGLRPFLKFYFNLRINGNTIAGAVGRLKSKAKVSFNIDSTNVNQPIEIYVSKKEKVGSYVRFILFELVRS